MGEKLSKIEIRSQILSILNKYRANNSPDNSDMSRDIEFIRSFEDKDCVAKVLFKEIENSKKQYESVCALFALEIIDVEMFKTYAFNFLQKKEIPEEKKFFVISLIKQKGIPFDYDNIDVYIKTDENAKQKNVKDFLSDIRCDLEAQIDLLDFYINISDEEKEAFILNLSDDIDDNDVAFALSILTFLDNEKGKHDEILNCLLESKSKYAILGLKHIIKNKETDFRTFQKIKKIIDNPENKSFNYNMLIKDSKPLESFISFVDGNSNFSFMFSRQKNNGLIDCFFTVIEIPKGILSSMGFGDINKNNYESIKKRLFSDVPPAKISPMALKSILVHYKNKNKKTSTKIPYEFWIWSKLLDDIETFNYDISDYINSRLDTVNLTSDKVLSFINNKILSSWFYVKGQNKYIDDIIDVIEKNHLIDLDEIDKITNNYIEEKFIKDESFMTNLKDKLLLQSYVSNLARLKMSSMVSYSLCFKNPFLNYFISSIVDRSIYYYFDYIIQNERKNIKTIFKAKTKFSIEEIETIMAQIEEKWS